MKTTKEVVNVSFDYDRLDILGVFGTRVFVKGTLWKIDDDDPSTDVDNDCVLVINRTLFLKTVGMWLDEKKRCCEAYNHFCGQMGSLRSDDYDEYEEKDRIRISDTVKMNGLDVDTGDWSYENTTKSVRTFKIKSFDDSVDMEHG